MTYSIWKLIRQDMAHMKNGSKSNLALHSLIIARSIEINFSTDHFEEELWTIRGDVTPLRPFILSARKYIWFKKLQLLKRYLVFFTEQLFADHDFPFTWHFLKELNGLSNKGRQVLWYNHLLSS